MARMHERPSKPERRARPPTTDAALPAATSMAMEGQRALIRCPEARRWWRAVTGAVRAKVGGMEQAIASWMEKQNCDEDESKRVSRTLVARWGGPSNTISAAQFNAFVELRMNGRFDAAELIATVRRMEEEETLERAEACKWLDGDWADAFHGGHPSRLSKPTRGEVIRGRAGIEDLSRPLTAGRTSGESPCSLFAPARPRTGDGRRRATTGTLCRSKPVRLPPLKSPLQRASATYHHPGIGLDWIPLQKPLGGMLHFGDTFGSPRIDPR